MEKYNFYLYNIITFSSDPALPMTLQPLSFANCPATIPTPPAAAEMNTFAPAFASPIISIPTQAANPATPLQFPPFSLN